MPRNEAAFFGRVMAESAQEIENLFAAIRQTATSGSGPALQDSSDVSTLTGTHDHLRSELIDRCDQGEQFAQALKKFAQVAEHRWERFHLSEIAEQIVHLCAPFRTSFRSEIEILRLQRTFLDHSRSSACANGNSCGY